MRAICLVGHGDLPKAMQHSAEMIAGDSEHLFAVSLSEEDGKEQFGEKLKLIDSLIPNYDSVLVFADLPGGSPCNTVLEFYGNDKRIEVVAGMNLAMVLAAMMSESGISEVIQEGQQSIRDMKNSAVQKPVQMKETIPLSDENKTPHILAGVRIDARGIHGQVATAWIPALHVDRILVIDDLAVKDEIQKSALKMAKPNSVKLSILSCEKAVMRLQDKLSYPGEKLFVILQRVDTLETLYKLNFLFGEINIGNVPNRPGTKSYRKTVHLTEEETVTIKKLIRNGTHFVAQMVPKDSVINFDEIINA